MADPTNLGFRVQYQYNIPGGCTVGRPSPAMIYCCARPCSLFTVVLEIIAASLACSLLPSAAPVPSGHRRVHHRRNVAKHASCDCATGETGSEMLSLNLRDYSFHHGSCLNPSYGTLLLFENHLRLYGVLHYLFR